MVCDEKSCTSSTRRATRLAQKSHSKFWPSDFELLPPVRCIFCPVRPSGSYVSCDDLQELCVSHIGSFCVPWHCSLISQSVQRLGTPFAWSATPLSFTCIGGPRLVMASLFVSSCCVHVISCYRCGCVFRFVWRARAPQIQVVRYACPPEPTGPSAAANVCTVRSTTMC